MTDSTPTRGQLERTLSQRIQALYRNRLGHRLGNVDCQIFDEKIAIVLENAVTQPEQLLANNGKEDLVEQIHSDISEVMQPQLKELIETIVGVPVVDLLTDTKLETERTGMIAVLSGSPQVRMVNGAGTKS
ncbi:MAG: DUF2294 domain-containing protein [Leptolyngbyaceae cyanobacterium HOT.MB2.61]|jgi:Uncharacterized conserved protein|nr:DUF2294 domain-containing protein [Leptolyngbyaceae cyanobacterium HOT.MB2.61]